MNCQDVEAYFRRLKFSTYHIATATIELYADRMEQGAVCSFACFVMEFNPDSGRYEVSIQVLQMYG